MSDKQFYVYTLARPDESVFYVGKGTGRRIEDHEAQARRGMQSYKCSVIRKIWRAGGEVLRAIVFTTDSEAAAHDEERRVIAELGRDTLCNLTDGGEGSSGYVPELKALVKISVSVKHRWADPAYRAAISAARKQQ